jgi:hypothetical protein
VGYSDLVLPRLVQVEWSAAENGSRDRFMENIMSQYKWYYKAKLAAEKFLPALDNNLDVDVEETSITPYDGGITIPPMR